MRGWAIGRSQRASVYLGAAAAFGMPHGCLARSWHRCPAHSSHCAHEMLRSRKGNCLQPAPSFCQCTAAERWIAEADFSNKHSPARDSYAYTLVLRPVTDRITLACNGPEHLSNSDTGTAVARARMWYCAAQLKLACRPTLVLLLDSVMMSMGAHCACGALPASLTASS